MGLNLDTLVKAPSAALSGILLHRGAVLIFLAVLPMNFFYCTGAAVGQTLQSLWEKGERELGEGRTEEANTTFQEALNIDPDNGRTWNYLGGISFSRKDYYKALLRFKRAAEASPDDAKIFNNLATTYDRLRQYRNAVDNYLKAIGIDPAYATPYRNLGAIYAYRMRDEALAEKYWSAYLELLPDCEDRDIIQEELERLKHP